MECNKEEAVRAKDIAEKKMETNDFVGARKIALKAQQLYPDLENISQLIMVCDVHCSAENRIYGNEKDWYGILKMEPTADEASIKKQYRKFALLLHPDKNKFSGAADAFKLIGEAQRMLLDREKRMFHDSKCKAAGKSAASNGAPQKDSGHSNVGKPPWAESNFMKNVTSQFPNKQCQQAQEPAQSGFFNNRPTFWTICPFCSVRYQYYRDVLNKLLGCQSCGKSFIGHEVNDQGAIPGTKRSQPAFPKQKEIRNQGLNKVGSQSNYVYSATKVGFEGNIGSGNTRNLYSKPGFTSEVGQGSTPNEKCGDVDMSCNKERKSEIPHSHGKMNGKKRKQIAESSESCNSESSTGSEEDVIIEEGGDYPAGDFRYYSDQYPRRSSRSKRNVSYCENLIDDNDEMKPSERAKCTGPSQATEEEVEDPSPKQEPFSMNRPAGLDAHMEEDEKEDKPKEHSSYEKKLQNEGRETEKESEKGKSTEDDATDPDIYEYPDPDFSDFDMDRKENCFAVGQIWAVYDTLDAMPRFYAQIRKVLSRTFKLRITWLEPDPDDEHEMKWVEEDLPVSCGNFRHGNSENTEDHPMFSHLVCWEKGRGRNTYNIYPRKGETWALFKNWDINWSSDPDNKRKYEYEFVEVLSNYADGIAVYVAYLGKLKGFACLFCRTMRKGVDLVEIPSKELFRFSHRIPSFQMTGEERKDIPKGSFELDPACLPTNLEEIDAPINEEVEAEKIRANGSCSRFPTDSLEPMPKSHADINQSDQKNHSDSNCNNLDNLSEDHVATPASLEEAYEIPDPKFYNFDADKSLEKFEIGQIWALYCDEDGLPKYYGKIKRIDLPECKLYISWLGACSTPKDMIQWIHEKMPICCGKFNLRKAKQKSYTTTTSFSHQVRAETTDKKDEYDIFPRKGEVWAIYKNWNAGMTWSDLENCEYDMVEVLKENDSGIDVLVLELVDGFQSVFKAQMKGQSTAAIMIPRIELLRFSHQIPAFRLTEESGGGLKGCLELDPAALPVLLFCSS